MESNQMNLPNLMNEDGFRNHTRTLFKRRVDFYYNVNHAILGIGGECGEVCEAILDHHIGFGVDSDKDNQKIIKEIGDLAFYTDALMNELGLTWKSCFDAKVTPHHTLFFLGLNVSRTGSRIVDEFKKCYIYGRPIQTTHFHVMISQLLGYLTALLDQLDSSWPDVWQTNYDKLKDRYPDGYSDQAALERKDQQ